MGSNPLWKVRKSKYFNQIQGEKWDCFLSKKWDKIESKDQHKIHEGVRFL